MNVYELRAIRDDIEIVEGRQVAESEEEAEQLFRARWASMGGLTEVEVVGIIPHDDV